MKTTLFFLLFLSTTLFAADKKEILQLVYELNLPTSTTLGDYKLGGLSGCAYDEKEKILWTNSDDRSEKGPARLYAFDVSVEGDKISLAQKKQLLLTNEKGQNFKAKTIDLEAIVLLSDKSFLLSSEGNGDLSPRLPPEIMHFSPEGKKLSSWKLPDYLIPEAKKKQTKGVRNNLAFEALTQIPQTEKFALINEQALIQDGEETGNETRSPSRLFIFEKNKLSKAYVYETDSYQDILGASVLKGDSGVSDMLALSEKEFLVLERSFFPTLLKTRIRLFKATIMPDSTEVSRLKSLKGTKYLPVKKTLLADFNEFIPKLDVKYSSLDNIEGLCFGPKLKDGKQSLIFVSDNNFNIFQRTQFLVFSVVSPL